MVAENTLSATTLNDVSPLLGRRSLTEGDYLGALVDELVVWNAVKTATDVSNFWNGGSGIEIDVGKGKLSGLIGLGRLGIR